MKILHIVPWLGDEKGGVSECVPEACRALKALGHEVGLVTCARGESKSAVLAEREGVRFHRFYGSAFRWNPVVFTWSMFFGLEKVMREYDVVHLNVDWLFPTWWGAHVARKLGKPYVLRPHGSFMPDRLVISSWKKRLAGFFFDRSVVRHASAVLAMSREEMEAIRAYEPTARALLVPCVINLSGMAGSEKAETGGARGKGEGGRRTLLSLSRISYVKGLDLLAEAWARILQSNNRIIGQWKLLVVGPDDRGYTEKMKRLFAERCPAGSYEFRGPAYGDEKWRQLANADAFVLPTRSENFGIAVAEAMASGLPVVCTKGAPWECLEKENAGRWTDISVEGIRRGLEDILSLDDEERRAMGARGRKWVESNCKRPSVVQKLNGCYEMVK